jgi:hypothetical protein
LCLLINTILIKILLLISFAFILVYLLLARDDRPNHAPIHRLNDQTNRPDNCSGVFSKCDKNNTLKLDNYNKKQKLSELRKNSKNELNKKLLSNNNLMLYGNSLESNIGNCNLTRPPNKDFYFGYVKFIKNTWSKVKNKSCDPLKATAGDKDTNCVDGDSRCITKGTKKYCNWNDDGRPVIIYYPSSVLKSTNTKNIPYIIFFSFVEWNSYDPTNPITFGIVNPDKSISCITDNKCDPYNEGWLHLQLETFLSAGYAVVMTTLIQYDSYQYLNCESDNLYNLCWNNGINPDAIYLTEMFKQITENTLMNDSEIIAGKSLLNNFDPTKLQLNKNECGLMGYSVGAQMVSRCINEFGTSIPNSPKVSVACMISGGSLHCYEYCNADAKTERGPKGKICKKQPSNYEPCWSKTTLGCCPKHLTEPIYDKKHKKHKHYKNHPPVILAQTSIDVFADPRASYNYYEKLQKMGVDTEIVTGLCGNHNLFPNAIIRILIFFKKYMPETPFSMI